MIKLSNDGPIVMVDDNAGDLFFVERCYRASHLDNDWVPISRGTELLNMLERVKEGNERMPSLILLDINMPGMTGLELLQAVRADPHFDTMPIFCVFTSSTDPRDAERAQRLGVSGFFTKAASVEAYVAFFDGLVK